MKHGTRIFAIDPGKDESGWVVYEHGDPGVVMDCDVTRNWELRASMRNGNTPHPWDQALKPDPDPCIRGSLPNVGVIEEIRSYRMRVGADIFTTCEWIGRFDEAWQSVTGESICRLGRKDLCTHICGTARANDADVRGALIHERFGGSRQQAVGTKTAPGPLHGVKKDAMQALALAITWAETVE